jgi:redox-sensitive bicupin YhaK (pirin superfamily)
MDTKVKDISVSIRNIVFRTQGKKHGPITRLVSPGDVGELIKPFVFLDYVQMENNKNGMFGPHPHSGIATLTTYISGDELGYGDSTGAYGFLKPGSVEWIQAGSGMWHWTHTQRTSLSMMAYQLWLSLPEELELAPAKTLYLESSLVEVDGPMRILLGEYKNLKSPIHYPKPITLLHVSLKKGETWSYQPATLHDIAWLAVNNGELLVSGSLIKNEIIVFEEGNSSITIEAKNDSQFLIASSQKHPHPLVLGQYSVHTSHAALAAGISKIRELSSTEIVRKSLQKIMNDSNEE